MADRASILRRTRTELGDFGSKFRDVFIGTGELDQYDLSAINVSDLLVSITDASGTTELTAPGDYTLDARIGRILLGTSYAPLPDGMTLTITGSGGGMFSDEDLEQLLTEALLQHTKGRTIRSRYRDEHGFIRYRDEAVTLETLPPVEELPVALLVTLNALWVLATDAAGDVDVSTPDGTQISRRQRYEQIISQISLVEERYRDLCAQLNVGLGRIEMFDLRRVSRTTGRLVPLFKAKEYDDHSLPTRKVPSVDSQDEDASGIPSIAYWGWW
ncbi:hypothetical protein ACIOHC_36015 [Streptomyces sp. NPDC088252]|uniref:hypothetical protein n=1 Tax=Streptomyces sp. NPDC088252 TaxID=3365845 RepID=UPI00381A3616